jgi:hypothetical protein
MLALDGSGQLHALTTLPLEKDPKTHLTGGCGPWSQCGWFLRQANHLPVLGLQTQTDQPTTSPHTHCVIPVPTTQIRKMHCTFHMTKIET